MTLYHWRNELGAHMLFRADGLTSLTCTFIPAEAADAALRKLSRIPGMRILHLCPPAILFTSVSLVSTEEFVASVRRLAAQSTPAAGAARGAHGAAPPAQTWALLPRRTESRLAPNPPGIPIPEMPRSQLALLVEAHHRELDACLESGNFDEARRIAARIRHLRREFLQP